MTLLALIATPLKGDDMIDLLEMHDADVIYEFDRLHEGTPDGYRASLTDAGVEMVFDDAQQLVTLFFYVLPCDGFAPVDPAQTGVPFHRSFGDAQAAFAAAGIPAVVPPSGQRWIKGDFGGHTVHYGFDDDGVLSRVTVEARGA
ncbi:MAG: hypothetical protein EOO24_28490 [Comamonadaceae bacterium]|nr:MAG: hypothetical protein EOO24_28490 [Comamonadaceae bacterium]